MREDFPGVRCAYSSRRALPPAVAGELNGEPVQTSASEVCRREVVALGERTGAGFTGGAEARHAWRCRSKPAANAVKAAQASRLTAEERPGGLAGDLVVACWKSFQLCARGLSVAREVELVARLDASSAKSAIAGNGQALDLNLPRSARQRRWRSDGAPVGRTQNQTPRCDVD